MDENTLVKATVIAYLLPLVCMVLSTIFAAQFLASDYLIAASAVMGLVIGGVMVRFHARNPFQNPKRKNDTCYHAIVVRKL